MAGIYIHIPFCKQACHYCDFHFSTSIKRKEEMIACIKKEIIQRSDFGSNKIIESIYFGGGTPSLLSSTEIDDILSTIQKQFSLSEQLEITLETNPDDLHRDYVRALSKTPINRLSIGIQSFDSNDLIFMNRAHNAEQSRLCLDLSQEYGFDNITVDLIFGSQTTSNTIWKRNLEAILDYKIPHLSIYGLSIEEGTALHHFVKSGKALPLDDQKFVDQFSMTQEILIDYGYEQYEVSNYSKGKRSQHNGNYWNDIPYLGIGPSAHSYDGQSRFWNISNNARYIKAISEEEIAWTKESLTDKDQYNELLLTRLRCIEGLSKSKLKKLNKKYLFHFEAMSETLLLSGQLKASTESFYIPRTHRIFTDQITQELFYTDDE